MTWWSGSAAVRRRLSQSRRSPTSSTGSALCRHSHVGGTAAQAEAANIPLTTFSEHRQIDLTIDGADEVERGTLNLIKGLGGALLREKIVAAASHRLTIVVDGSKLVDRLGTRTPVPVEVAAFGLEATRELLEVLGANAGTRMSSDAPFVTDSGNSILDCDFSRIADPARLDERIRRIVGVVGKRSFYQPRRSGLCGRRQRCPSPRQPSRSSGQSADPGGHGRVGVRKIDDRRRTLGAARLAVRGGRFTPSGIEYRQDAHRNSAHGCRPPAVAGARGRWIDGQRAKKQPGIITCSALKRSYRQIIIGDRPEARLVYLRSRSRHDRRAFGGRHGHFMPAALLRSQIDTLEEPDPSEDPLTVDVGASAAQIADEIIRLLGASVTVVQGVPAHPN